MRGLMVAQVEEDPFRRDIVIIEGARPAKILPRHAAICLQQSLAHGIKPRPLRYQRFATCPRQQPLRIGNIFAE